MALVNYELLDKLKKIRTFEDFKKLLDNVEISTLKKCYLIVYSNAEIDFFTEVIYTVAAIYGIELNIEKINAVNDINLLADNNISPILILSEDLESSKKIYLEPTIGNETKNDILITNLVKEIENIIDNIKKTSPLKQIFINTLPDQFFPLGGIQSDYELNGLDTVLMNANWRLKNFAHNGKCHLIKNRYYTTYEKSFFSLKNITHRDSDFLPHEYQNVLNFSIWVLHHIYPIFFQRIKAIAVDLDDTVWEGTIGEDGEEIFMNSVKGQKYFHSMLQLNLNHLSRQGVLIGIISRNDKYKIEQILNHNEQRYKLLFEPTIIEADLFSKKSELISNMCLKLDGIDANTTLFIDNSDIEREEVRRENKSTVAFFPNTINQFEQIFFFSPYIEKTNIGNVDKGRALWYKEKSKGNLEFKVNLIPLESNPELTNRIHDLINKTNQFNFTSERMNIEELNTLINSNLYLVLGIFALPPTGSNLKSEICGVIIIKKITITEWVIENFILSCRYIGLEIDNKSLKGIINLAVQNKVKYIIGKYRWTSKNNILKDWYTNHGFIKISGEDKANYYRGRASDLDRLEFSKDKELEKLKIILKDRSILKYKDATSRIRTQDLSEEILIKGSNYKPGISVEDAKIINSYFGIYPGNETNIREIEVGDFYMDKFCITNKKYSHFINVNYEKNTRETFIIELKLKQPKNKIEINALTKEAESAVGTEEFPAIVPYSYAVLYSDWVNAKIPSEWEWEWAARGADGRWFPWGYNLPEDNVLWNNNKTECNVDNNLKNISPFGIVGMVGSVWQWCSNIFNNHQQYRGGDFNYDSYYWKRVTLRPIESNQLCGNLVGIRLIRHF